MSSERPLPAKPEEDPDASIEESPEDSGIPDEVIAQLPKDQQSLARSMFASFQHIVRSPANPIYEKVTGEHISDALKGIERDSQRDFEDAQRQRKFNLTYALIGCAMLLSIICLFLFSEDSSFKSTLFVSVTTAIGGFGAGIGASQKMFGQK